MNIDKLEQDLNDWEDKVDTFKESFDELHKLWTDIDSGEIDVPEDLKDKWVSDIHGKITILLSEFNKNILEQ
jgi:hypothetical protein